MAEIRRVDEPARCRLRSRRDDCAAPRRSPADRPGRGHRTGQAGHQKDRAGHIHCGNQFDDRRHPCGDRWGATAGTAIRSPFWSDQAGDDPCDAGFGGTAPGQGRPSGTRYCYRLWPEKEQAALAPRRPPEILDADLAPLMLDLAYWGTTDPSELSWLTRPPTGSVAQAKELLIRLGALDVTGRITPHGKQMGELPLHPRLSHMLLKSVLLNRTGLACDLAALLSERDILRGPSGARQADLRLRLDVLQGDRDHVGSASVDRSTIQRVNRTADVWRRQLGRQANARQADKPEEIHQAGVVLALAYPDRIANVKPAVTRVMC